ncbi:hypothetical protein [Streptomyces tibetensis]|uniref:hypothetical protein n=1 Tax=Streptomyces tibetensis TaxID=2382123 RepID=UPI0033E631B5
MSSTQTEITPAQQALALLTLPSLDGLTEDQARGFTCVWDSSEKPLAEDVAVDLGRQHLRGCPEHVARESYEALFRHCMEDCEDCGRTEEQVKDEVSQETSCEVGVTLRRLVIRKGRL